MMKMKRVSLLLTITVLLGACVTQEQHDPAVVSLMQRSNDSGGNVLFRKLVNQHADKVNTICPGYNVATPL